MKSIGFRCWKDKFSYVVLDGDQENPERILSNHITLPKNFSRPEQLAWFRKEIIGLLDNNDFNVVIFKATEPISQSKEPARGELEGLLQEAAFSHSKKIIVESRIKSQLNSKTNARKAKYLGELLTHDAFNGLSKANFEDAYITALSGLPK
ncbi:MAG: hypothetical protein V4581_15630 [Bacteroidota bacterium]